MTVISRDGHLVYVTWPPTTPSDTFATLSFAKLLRLLACRLKYSSNGRDKEKEESSMSGSRNDLLQSCWDRVTNRQWHVKPWKSIKICRDDHVNNKGRFILIWTWLGRSFFHTFSLIEEAKNSIHVWCVTTAPGVSPEFFFPVGKLNNLTIFP